LRAKMHAYVAVNGYPAARHACTDPFDSAAIAFNHNLAIGAVAFGGEEFAELRGRIAVLHGQRENLSDGLARQSVGGKAFCFDRNSGRSLAFQLKHVASSRFVPVGWLESSRPTIG